MFDGATRIRLSDEQEKAVDKIVAWYRNPFSQQQVFRVDGYAGTGKTTMIKAAIQATRAKRVVYGAYTGKAAYVMNLKGIPARTIHSLLYVPFEVKEEDEETGEIVTRVKYMPRTSDEVKCAELIVLDEVSMVGEDLARDLLALGSKILILGDPGQLPPIYDGQGAFYKGRADVTLTTILRQASDSGILRVATKARLGQCITFADVCDEVSIVSKDDIRVSDLLDVDQVLCGKNSTRHELNSRMRKKLGFSFELPLGNPPHREKLICLKNNKDAGILNGQFFTLENVSKGRKRYTFTADVRIDGTDDLTRQEISRITFRDESAEHPKIAKKAVRAAWGYAITVHKSQGSEWGRVALVDDWRGRNRENWLYTAITRAANHITIVVN